MKNSNETTDIIYSTRTVRKMWVEKSESEQQSNKVNEIWWRFNNSEICSSQTDSSCNWWGQNPSKTKKKQTKTRRNNIVKYKMQIKIGLHIIYPSICMLIRPINNAGYSILNRHCALKINVYLKRHKVRAAIGLTNSRTQDTDNNCQSNENKFKNKESKEKNKGKINSKNWPKWK